MLYAGLCIAELFILFLMSRTLTREISFFLYRLTHSKKITVYLLALLFLPGTIVHELAHFFTAKLLLVYAGKIRLIPELNGQQVKLGTVQVGVTDPIRRFFIGAAPFFTGTLIVLITFILIAHFRLAGNYLALIITGYITFEVGNTMFSSKKDMEGAIELLIIILVLIALSIFLQIHIEKSLLEFLQTKSLEPIFRTGSLILAIPLGIDVIIIFLIKSLQKLLF
jgi:hypothetical protein